MMRVVSGALLFCALTVAVVGATGAVGNEMIATLEERNFPLDKLRLFASERSEGKTLDFHVAEPVLLGRKNGFLFQHRPIGTHSVIQPHADEFDIILCRRVEAVTTHVNFWILRQFKVSQGCQRSVLLTLVDARLTIQHVRIE